RLHLHFLQAPEEFLDEDGDGRVDGLRMRRMELDGSGGVRPSQETVDYPVQAVYRAVGYFGSPVEGVEFDEVRGVIPNAEGRVLDADGAPVPGLYASGWIKRGPVGLIGHTKGDSLETIKHLIEDEPGLWRAQEPSEESVIELLESREVPYTTWAGWHALDDHEKSLGVQATQAGPVARERVKVVDREEMTRISRDGASVPTV
ncbi:pyridine nucleotide-disulfide oxidoreductase, partial [Micrococcus luteus]|nr:pyridine nucleotide-disulfide oxidoreductase [Micrococcus luteus]